MPSYVLTPFLELDEVLCKNFLNLDLKDAPKTTVPTTKPVGFKNSQPVSPLPLGGSAFNTGSAGQISDVGLCLQSSKWSRPTEQPPPPGLSKIPFWVDRSISMIESDSGSLGWAASDSSLTQQTVASDPADEAVAAPSSSRYKTEMCRTFEESGNCKYGAKCQFAHGYNEIRGLNRHPKYKTEFCRTFHTVGFCPYGIRCHFIHNAEEELQARPPQQPAPRNRRPQLLRQSISFAGFPSAPHPKEISFPFSAVASTSPPPSTGIPELLPPAFPNADSFPIFTEAGLEPGPQFLLSSDSPLPSAGTLATRPLLPKQPPPSPLPPAEASHPSSLLQPAWLSDQGACLPTLSPITKEVIAAPPAVSAAPSRLYLRLSDDDCPFSASYQCRMTIVPHFSV
ncbi:mRNA decay activator protein ZFP36L1, partial [Acipenser oxyrinchus oxyrinchus]